MRLLFMTCLLAFFCATAQNSRCLFYPTAITGMKNLIDADAIAFNTNDWSEFTTAKGSPFSTNDPAWSVKTSKNLSAYWHTSAKIQTGRTYLTGAWIRFANAKILFWNYGHNTKTNMRWDKRLYCFSGFNDKLIPYLSERSRRNIQNDPDKWLLCYRIFTADAPLKNNELSLNFGLYMSVGAMTFARPFLIDITDIDDTSITIDIRNSPKPIAKLVIIDTANGDDLWTKNFEKPVTDFNDKVGGTVDFRTNLDVTPPKGYNLFITYQDGTSLKLAAPQGGLFLSRE